MWIAKDGFDNSIWIFDYKPTKNEKARMFQTTDYSDNAIELNCTDKELYALFGIKDLTFENSPIEIEIKVKQ